MPGNEVASFPGSSLNEVGCLRVLCFSSSIT